MFKQSFIYRIYIFLLVMTLSYQYIFSADFWITQQSGTTKKLYKCFFTDSLNGWAAGDSGLVLHTSSGGISWNAQPTGIDHFIFDVNFINSSTGWCIASNVFSYPRSILLKTTNGGGNWQQQLLPDSSMTMFTCYFKDNSTGWIAGINGIILKTTNNGNNWLNVRDTTSFGGYTVWNISSKNTDFAYGCGGIMDLSGVLWKSNQNGTVWNSQGIGPEPFFKIIFRDSLNGFGVGGDLEFGASTVRTTNGGVNWVYENLGLFGLPRSYAYRTPEELWMVLGFGRAWGLSVNGGYNWLVIPSADSALLNDVFFPDYRHGWAVGDNGIIQKYNNSIIGINNNNSSVPENFSLRQNYPNPFNSSTIIEFNIEKPSRVKLILYDASGKEIKVLFDDFFERGNNRFSFSAFNLSSGIYFYSLVTPLSSKSRKLVIVK